MEEIKCLPKLLTGESGVNVTVGNVISFPVHTHMYYEMTLYEPFAGSITVNYQSIVMDRPAVIHWRFIHWVVFCGMNEAGEPVICNSSNGRYSVPVSYFRQFFTDYVLTNGTPDDLISEDYFDENAKAPDDYFDK